MATPLLGLDPAAGSKLAEMRGAGRFDGSALRVSVREHGAVFRHPLELVEVGSRGGGGFRFEKPNRARLLEVPLAAKAQRILDDEINPGIAAHGGSVAL